MRRLRLAACLLAAPMPLAAQEVGIGLGRFLEGNDLTYFRADLFLPKAAVVDLAPLVEYRTGEGNEGETVRFFGAGVDASIFRGAGAGPYGIVGLVGGLGSGDGDTFWGSWSLGLGWQLITTDAVSFSAEGRYRGVSQDSRNGWELGLRFGIRYGPFGHPPPSDQVPPVRPAPDPDAPDGQLQPGVRPTDAPHSLPVVSPPPDGVPPEATPTAGAMLVMQVIETAREAMGQPYKWGGDGDDGGFDCSGLIQYAYAEHGVELPRTSRDQAKEGRAVEKSLAALQPGDILTFARSGNTISHVGLYLGEGQFLHSASRGVQVSVLSDSDPYGRWWFRRWKGARRVVE
ncbi:MAG TPA: NlpC/P60 family protein [Gemmatimonadales bacterium]|nr:NlpC/P60 family protein [Gemmatimonadales bacterium]